MTHGKSRREDGDVPQVGRHFRGLRGAQQLHHLIPPCLERAALRGEGAAGIEAP
jgi:hypothetical protein